MSSLMSKTGSRWRTSLALLMLAFALPAQAQLSALRYDRASSNSGLAAADAASAVLTPLGAGGPGRVLGAGVSAFDPFNQVLYSVGPDPAGAALPWLLYGFEQLTGNVLPPVSLDQAGGILAAVHDQTNAELQLLLNSAGTVGLYAVNPASGALTLRVAGPVGCCNGLVNAVASVNGTTYLSAAVGGVGPQLVRFPTDGSPASSVALSDALAVLRLDPVSGQLFGIVQDNPTPGSASAQLVQVDPATGALTPVGAPLVDCCAIAPGVAAVSNGALVVVAGPLGAGATSFLSFDLLTGVASFSAASIDSQAVINGLYDLAKGLELTTTTITAVMPSPVEIGQSYTVSVSVTSGIGPVTGMVLVTDELGNNCTITLPASSCVLPATAIGGRVITATYMGEAGFAGSFDTAAQTVIQATSSTLITSVVPPGSQVIGQPYTVSVAVTGFMPTGDVTVDDGAGAMCLITLPATSCLLNSTVVGPKTLTASYPGDINNTPSADSVGYTISQSPSLTTITSVAPPGSQTVGQPYTVTVSVSGFGTPTGSVAVDDGAGAMCSILLPATSCMLTSTVAGPKTLTASYGGDLNNLPSADTEAYLIDPAASTTLITSIVPPGSSPVGSAYTVNVSVTGFGTPTGSIAVDDGAGAMCTITLPAGSCQLTSTSIGPKTISAAYGGDGNNLPSSDSEAYTIDQAASSTTIDSVLPNPAVVGAAYTVTVTVSGFNPTGTVAVDDGDGAMCSISLPATSCQLTSSSSGPKTITASYGGDVNNLGSSDTASQMIMEAQSVTTITSIAPAGSQTVGVAYTVNVTVTGFGPPTGTVAVDDGAGANCAIVLPATSCMLTSTVAGPKTISASYPGDVNNLGSSDTESYLIDRASSSTTIFAVTPPGSSVVGVAYSVQVSISGFGTATGTVAIDDGAGAGCTITLPATSCSLSSVLAGPKTLSASYSGDVNNLPSSGTLPYQIDRAVSATLITAIAPPAPNAGEAYTVSVAVSGFGTPVGDVLIDDGAGASCSLSLPASGCQLVSTVAGSLTITASYAGDVNNLPSTTSQLVTVGPAPTSTVLTANPDPVVAGQPVVLTANVSQNAAQGVALSGTVDFFEAGLPITGCSAVVLNAGVANCSTSFVPFGDRNLSASYSGDANNLPSSGQLQLPVVRVATTTTIVLDPPVVNIKGPVFATITVSGGFPPLSGTVSLTANGVPIPECQNLPLNAAGQAICGFQLFEVNEYLIEASYSGDVDDEPSSGSAALLVAAVAIPVFGVPGALLLALLIAALGWRGLGRR